MGTLLGAVGIVFFDSSADEGVCTFVDIAVFVATETALGVAADSTGVSATDLAVEVISVSPAAFAASSSAFFFDRRTVFLGSGRSCNLCFFFILTIE